MRCLRFFSLLLFLLIAFRCLSASDPAPISLEQCQGPYRIQPYLAVATALQALPEETRIATLRSWAGGPDDKYRAFSDYPNDTIITLCRMLFQGRDGRSLRRPHSGAPQFVGEPITPPSSTERIMEAYPAEPLHWVGDIPFRVVLGYSMGGSPEPATRYLDYCIAEGEWTDRRFSPASDEQLQQALDQLLQRSWLQPLKPHEIAFLRAQLDPYSPPPLKITSFHVGTLKKAGASYTVYSLDLLVTRPVTLETENDPLQVGLYGGAPPYRMTISLFGPKAVATELSWTVDGRATHTNPFKRELLPLDLKNSLPIGTRVRLAVRDAAGNETIRDLILDAPRTYRAMPAP